MNFMLHLSVALEVAARLLEPSIAFREDRRAVHATTRTSTCRLERVPPPSRLTSVSAASATRSASFHRHTAHASAATHAHRVHLRRGGRRRGASTCSAASIRITFGTRKLDRVSSYQADDPAGAMTLLDALGHSLTGGCDRIQSRWWGLVREQLRCTSGARSDAVPVSVAAGVFCFGAVRLLKLWSFARRKSGGDMDTYEPWSGAGGCGFVAAGVAAGDRPWSL